MNKTLYMTCIISITLGLYIPRFMQFPVTLLIVGSFLTYIIISAEEFFGERSEDNE